MAVDKIYVENLLESMNFSLLNGTKNKWEKQYTQHNDYLIQVDFEKEDILYVTREEDLSVSVSSNVVTNFSKDENFVVLECVDRLLEKGYKPNSLELEHAWPSGHGTSGRLDILVKKDDNPYLMIECKTYGECFEKEKENMLITKKVGKELQPKGQLFSYCFQEKSTEYLCLYASIFCENEIKIQNVIIPVEESWKTLSNQKELFNHWNKSFKKNGIFEKNITPYNIECKSLLRGDLDKITDKDSSIIFNQFLEILRHNAVSDKTNAFNKILNLFICKIVDEDRNDDEEVLFQWKDDSSYISLQSSLSDLYKKGMDRFLDIDVTDYSDSEIENKIALIDSDLRSVVKKMFQEIRLQKSSEFTFKEVYNEESFEENAKVLKEVVELLQPYQFRYGHKQQFLGNFFELLLNTSIKQESGQYFTPTPIARFMISSLPIKEKIDDNIDKGGKDIIPNAIDYACGSGHFITEYMDIVQNIINEYNTSHLRKSTKNIIEKWKQSEDEDSLQGEFEWAKYCVYGIEKDYRLVKTTKISTFLNGDGEANIIHADGLDKFTSNKYRGLLKSIDKENNNFDFLIANPPYSVSSFKSTLSSDNSDFDTYRYLTESSSEIECLFVERAKQLLKDGGCAAIILPTPILTNTSGITEKTREILLKNFYIKAISKMGGNTFMATDTNTVILFVQKRRELDCKSAERFIDEFFESYNDFAFEKYQNVISRYISKCFDNIEFADYISLIKSEPNEKIKDTNYFKKIYKSFEGSKEYKNLKKRKDFKKLTTSEQSIEINQLFGSMIKAIEKEKIMYYLLTFTNKTLLMKTGEKRSEKDFLGYDFSNRRGYEGIHPYTDENGYILSSLYDEEELNTNPSKANYYINKTFKNEYPDINEDLVEHLRYTNSSDLLVWDEGLFNNIINISKKPKIKYSCDSMPIKECITVKIGGTPSRRNRNYFTGDNLWVSISELNGQKITDTKEKITDTAVDDSNVKLIKKGTTLLSFKLSVGKVALAGKNLYTNEAIAALEIKDDYKNKVLNEYLFYLFKSKAVDIAGETKAFGISLNKPTLEEIIIPIPQIIEQVEFVNDCKKLEGLIEINCQKIEYEEDNINDYVNSLDERNYPKKHLGDDTFVDMRRGPFGAALKKEIFVSSGYKVYEQKHAINNNFNIGRYYITEKKFNEMKNFELLPNDIIMSCSGTIGKFALAPLDLKPGIINQALLRFRPKNIVLPQYLKLYLEHISSDFQEKSHGLGLQNITSVNNLEDIAIPLPALDEQQKILDRINEYKNKISKIEQENAELQARKLNLIKKYI